MGMTIREPRILARVLADDGRIPNSRLPLLLYRGALELPACDPAAAIEALIRANGWGNDWRDGIYPFHHYHSTAHEVLIVYRGSARVQLGGEEGIIETVEAGDVILIPAGVGHKNLGSSADPGVIGAYPPGQEWDLCTGRPEERPRADENIARVPLPATDPVFGPHGPLLQHWRERR